MKRLKFLLSISVLLVLTQIIVGQPISNIETTTYSDEDILQKIEQLNNQDYMIMIQETGAYLVPLSLAFTHEDSLNLQYEEIPYTLNRIRFDPQVLSSVLPNVVTIDDNKQLQVEHLSLIPVLFEAVQKQQILIHSLNSRISELEQNR